MLKGKDKGVVGENVRELKSKGMSERDAVMASMKNSPKKAKKGGDVSPSSPREDYPYGTRLELDHETLTKLGHTSMPQVGDTFHLHAKAKVTSASEHSSEGEDGPRRSVSLQITHMRSRSADDDNDASSEPDADEDDCDTGSGDCSEE